MRRLTAVFASALVLAGCSLSRGPEPARSPLPQIKTVPVALDTAVRTAVLDRADFPLAVQQVESGPGDRSSLQYACQTRIPSDKQILTRVGSHFAANASGKPGLPLFETVSIGYEADIAEQAVAQAVSAASCREYVVEYDTPLTVTPAQGDPPFQSRLKKPGEAGICEQTKSANLTAFRCTMVVGAGQLSCLFRVTALTEIEVVELMNQLIAVVRDQCVAADAGIS